MRIRIKDFDDPKIVNFAAKKTYFFNHKLQDVQATEEAFSPQKRTSRFSKHENSSLQVALRQYPTLLDDRPLLI